MCCRGLKRQLKMQITHLPRTFLGLYKTTRFEGCHIVTLTLRNHFVHTSRFQALGLWGERKSERGGTRRAWERAGFFAPIPFLTRFLNYQLNAWNRSVKYRITQIIHYKMLSSCVCVFFVNFVAELRSIPGRNSFSSSRKLYFRTLMGNKANPNRNAKRNTKIDVDVYFHKNFVHILAN